MNLKETLEQLEALGNEKVRARNTKNGAGDNQHGVQLGNLRKLAKQIKADHALGLALWETENIDARLLAILLIKPQKLSSSQLHRMVRATSFPQLADWLNAYVVKKHPDKEALREKWMKAKHPMAARAGWNLTAERVVKSPEGLDRQALRIPMLAVAPHRAGDGGQSSLVQENRPSRTEGLSVDEAEPSTTKYGATAAPPRG